MKDSKRVVEVDGTISLTNLAKQMSLKAEAIYDKARKLGVEITSDDMQVDVETATLLAQEFSYEVKDISFREEAALSELRGVTAGAEKSGELRSPVVTIMGHVDHGKTSLLDKIRNAKVAAGEAGGITQHIGAYSVALKGKKITFIDTPGHEAFTKMRGRGAKTTDIVVLVVAANDGVMPQTIEAINHAKAANVPIIVAINKVDLHEADPGRVKTQLTEHGVVSEEWGGDAIMCPVSAVSGQGIEELLEAILLQAEVMDLRADANLPAKGTILESRLDKNAGALATVLVQEGTLRAGDFVVSGVVTGRVRRMSDDKGNVVKEAGPSTPVEILGLSGVPDAGDPLLVVADERKAKEVIDQRQVREREKTQASPAVTLEQLYARMQQGQVKELAIILKADVRGSLEACLDALNGLTGDQVKINVIHSGCGGITESDVQLAVASKGLIFGFSVRPDTKAMRLAEHEKVAIKTYKIIYEMIDEVKLALKGMLGTKKVEHVLGRAEVRQTFSVPKIGVIAGTAVTDGKIMRSSSVRLLRDSRVIFEGRISSLKRFKEDVREVEKGYECGIGIENFNDIKQGDVIETFMVEEVPVELSAGA
jgi:translation initiation factor IF-2